MVNSDRNSNHVNSNKGIDSNAKIHNDTTDHIGAGLLRAPTALSLTSSLIQVRFRAVSVTN